jgi:CheY-like chemotaxis protein
MSLHILVVDDDSLLRSYVREILEHAGHSVRECATGKEALSTVQLILFDAVIIDIVMPDMDGLELIVRLKSLNPALSLIAISGAFVGGLRLASEHGVKATLQKPFAPSQLLNALEPLQLGS